MKLRSLIAIALTTASLLAIPKLSEASSALFNRSSNYLVLVNSNPVSHVVQNTSAFRQTVVISADVEFIVNRLNSPLSQQGRYQPFPDFSRSIRFVIEPGESVIIRFRGQNPAKRVNLSVSFFQFNLS